MMKKRLIYLAIFSILATSLATFGINFFKKDERFNKTLQDTTTEEYVDQTMPIPNGKNPSDMTAIENIFIALGVFKDKKSYQYDGESKSEVRVDLMKLHLINPSIEKGWYKNGNLLLDSYSVTKHNKLIKQRLENREKDIFIERDGENDEKNNCGIYDLSKKPKRRLSKEDYHENYGIRQKSPSVFIINTYTIKDAFMEKEENLYKITLTLDIEIAPELHKRTLKTLGGATYFPVFTSDIKQTFYIDENWEIKRVESNFSYETDRAGGTKISSSGYHNFTYEDIDIKDFDYFKQYSDIEIVEYKEEKNVLDILGKSFFPYLGNGFNIEIEKDNKDFLKGRLFFKLDLENPDKGKKVDIKELFLTLIPYNIDVILDGDNLSLRYNDTNYLISLNKIKELVLNEGNKEIDFKELLNKFTLEEKENEYKITLLIKIGKENKKEFNLEINIKKDIKDDNVSLKVGEIFLRNLNNEGLFKELKVKLVDKKYEMPVSTIKNEVKIDELLTSSELTIENLKVKDNLLINKVAFNLREKELFTSLTFNTKNIGKITPCILIKENDIYIKLNNNIVKIEIESFIKILDNFIKNNNIDKNNKKVKYLFKALKFPNTLFNSDISKIEDFIGLFKENKPQNNLNKKINISNILNILKDIKITNKYDNVDNIIIKNQAVDLLTDEKLVEKYLNYGYLIIKRNEINEIRENFNFDIILKRNNKDHNINLKLGILKNEDTLIPTIKGILEYNNIILNLLLDESGVYVSFNNTTLRCDLSDLLTIISKRKRNNLNKLDLIDNFEIFNDYIIKLKDLIVKLAFDNTTISYKDNLKVVITKIDNFNININKENQVNIINDKDILLKYVNIIKDIIKEKELNEYLNIKTSIKLGKKIIDLDIKANIIYENKNLVVKALINYQKLTFNVLYEDSNIYLSLNNKVLKFSLNDIKELFNLGKRNSLEDILLKLNIEEGLNFTLGNLNLKLNMDNILLNYKKNKANINLDISRCEPFSFNLEKDNYLVITKDDISNIKQLIDKYKPISNGFIQINNLSITRNDFNVIGSFKFDVKKKAVIFDGTFKYRNIKTTFNLIFEDKKLYLTLFNKLNLILEKSDITKIYSLLNEFGFDLNKKIKEEKLLNMLNGNRDINNVVSNIFKKLDNNFLNKIRTLMDKALKYTDYNFDSFTIIKNNKYDSIDNLVGYLKQINQILNNFSLSNVLNEYYNVFGNFIRNDEEIVSFNSKITQRLIEDKQTFALDLFLKDIKKDQDHRGHIQYSGDIFLKYNKLNIHLNEDTLKGLVKVLLKKSGFNDDEINKILSFNLKSGISSLKKDIKTNEVNLDIIFKELKINSKNVYFILNKDFLKNKKNPKDVELTFGMEDNKLTTLIIKDLAVGKGYLNIDLRKDSENDVKILTSDEKDNYLLFNNVDFLASAIINTISKKNFHIKAEELDVKVSLFNLKIQNIDIKVEIDDKGNRKVHAKYYIDPGVVLKAGGVIKNRYNNFDVYVYNKKIYIKRKYKENALSRKDSEEITENDEFQSLALHEKLVRLFALGKNVEKALKENLKPRDENTPIKPYDTLLKDYNSPSEDKYNLTLDMATFLSSPQFKDFNLEISLSDNLISSVKLTGSVSVIRIKDASFMISYEDFSISYPSDFEY